MVLKVVDTGCEKVTCFLVCRENSLMVTGPRRTVFCVVYGFYGKRSERLIIRIQKSKG